MNDVRNAIEMTFVSVGQRTRVQDAVAEAVRDVVQDGVVDRIRRFGGRQAEGEVPE